ncbi:hypothetical protein KAS08_02455 [Candidatus Pacearchaeota archaeon]|nr:hypothetical protein [Candidatus Pacearchaeota archaeon]
MGKRSRPFTLDEELFEELGKINASGLINELLKDYFNKNQNETIVILNEKLAEETEKKKVSLRKIREIKQKIAKIRAKESKVLRVCNKIPQEILTDFKSYPNLSPAMWMMRFKDIYKKKYRNLQWMDVKTALKEFQGQK